MTEIRDLSGAGRAAPTEEDLQWLGHYYWPEGGLHVLALDRESAEGITKWAISRGLVKPEMRPGLDDNDNWGEPILRDRECPSKQCLAKPWKPWGLAEFYMVES